MEFNSSFQIDRNSITELEAKRIQSFPDEWKKKRRIKGKWSQLTWKFVFACMIRRQIQPEEGSIHFVFYYFPPFDIAEEQNLEVTPTPKHGIKKALSPRPYCRQCASFRRHWRRNTSYSGRVTRALLSRHAQTQATRHATAVRGLAERELESNLLSFKRRKENEGWQGKVMVARLSGNLFGDQK